MKETRQDSNDCDEAERLLMRVLLIAGAATLVLGIFALGMYVCSIMY